MTIRPPARGSEVIECFMSRTRKQSAARWTAIVVILFSLTVVIPSTLSNGAAAAPRYYNALVSGEELIRGESLTSPSLAFKLVFQSDGNLVAYNSSSNAIWSSGTQGTGVRLAMQKDGNAVIYSSTNQAVWLTDTNEPGATLSFQDDGNLVLYRTDYSPAWASSTNGFIAPREHPSLAPNDSLRPKHQLTSRAGGFRAVMQSDGNFVVYGPSGALWSSRTSGSGNYLVMQGDGNAVIYSSSGTALWTSGSSGKPGSEMWMQDDDNLVVYDGGQAVWSRR
ncbi:curculin domain-containing protein [Rathayibacter sp. AY1E8]|nr:curculin domain-containing protein [Rathayibacter sp. AY1E6]PPG16387.1 curculin domain-containing protein [Rathayibacter sp. AY1E8]